jgi:NADPH-dependent curcumin reductase
MTASNHQIRLAARPTGLPTDANWEATTEPVPSPGEGEVLVAISHISIDPAMRGWMNAGASYIPPVEVGAVMRAATIGRVVESRAAGFASGDHVYGVLGVQEYATVAADELTAVDPDQAPLPTYLGALGISGLTAYFGLLDVGRVTEGDTVLVSGAAGAVGSVVGQIAAIKGARAVGIAGGPDKCAWLTDELGFSAAVDYKAPDVIGQLRRHTPDRVNVFFDNVGGDILDAGLTRLARGARVVICGGVSQYNAERVTGPSNYLALLVARASMTGMVVFDYAPRYGEGQAELARWLGEGRLIAREQVITGGVDAFPDALLALFRGENTGKLVLAIE